MICLLSLALLFGWLCNVCWCKNALYVLNTADAPYAKCSLPSLRAYAASMDADFHVMVSEQPIVWLDVRCG